MVDGKERVDEPADGLGALQVRRVASASDDLEMSARDALSHVPGTLQTGLVQRSGDDQAGAADAREQCVERPHGALPSTAKRGGEPSGSLTQTLVAQLLAGRLGQRHLAREERLCLPRVDEGNDAVALDTLSQSCIGLAAAGTLGVVSDARRGALEQQRLNGVGLPDGHGQRDARAHRVTQHRRRRCADLVKQLGKPLCLPLEPISIGLARWTNPCRLA